MTLHQSLVQEYFLLRMLTWLEILKKHLRRKKSLTGQSLESHNFWQPNDLSDCLPLADCIETVEDTFCWRCWCQDCQMMTDLLTPLTSYLYPRQVKMTCTTPATAAIGQEGLMGVLWGTNQGQMIKWLESNFIWGQLNDTQCVKLIKLLMFS